MTLVVYKNHVIAADSRGSVTNNIPKGSCAHCSNEVGRIVNDAKDKIKVSLTDDINYRGSKVLAIAGSGSSSFTAGMKTELLKGSDIESLFTLHCRLLGDSPPATASLLIVTESNVFVLRTYDPEGRSRTKIRKYHITTHELNETVMIGGGREQGEVIDNITGKLLHPAEIIELVKESNQSVGGPVFYHNLKHNRVDQHKFDPQTARFTKSKILEAIESIPIPE